MSSIDLWYATRATGIASLVLLTWTVTLGILAAGRAPSTLPGFARAEVHRRVALLTVVFLALHVLTTLLDTYVHVGWLSLVVPFASGYRRWWTGLGTVGVDTGIAVVVSSLLRTRIPARLWRAIHWLAYLSWPVAVAHSLGMGTDTALTWVLGLLAACIALVVAAAGWRLAGALSRRRALPVTALPVRRSLRPAPVRGRALG